MEIVSPGGMIDGFKIQELDINHVASMRRNPVLCDIFHRLKLMERRGSGLQKIKDAYTPEFEPKFMSTPQTFVVSLKNNNYGKSDTDKNFVTDNVTDILGRKNVSDKIEKRYKRILELLKQDKTITVNSLATEVKVSERTILRDLATLKEQGRINRNGSDVFGEWIVAE
jgi:predicted HTH transcriptional regulator